MVRVFVTAAVVLLTAVSCSSKKDETAAPAAADGPHQDGSGGADYREVDALFQRVWREGSVPGWREQLSAILERPNLSAGVLFHIAANLRDFREDEHAEQVFKRLEATLSERASGPDARPRDISRLATAQLATGQITAGVATLKRLVTTQAGRDAFCSQELGVRFTHARKGDPAPLVTWASTWLKARPDCENLALALAEMHQKRADYAAAITLLAPLVDGVEAPSPALLDKLAGAYRASGQAHEAVARYRQICALGRCDARTRGNLVWAQADYHRQPEVMAEAIKRADAAPDDHLRQFEVGVMLHYARDYTESDRFLTRARKSWPTDPRILLYTAMNAYRGGRFDEARVEIKEAQANAEGEDADLFYCYAVIFRNHDLPVAIENLQRYQQMAERVGSSTRKAKMVSDFLSAMRAEQARRAAGEAPRPFADPEADYFGEPPGSPGHAPNAIRVTR